jgi:AraC-like DNA-binding protein
MSLSSVPRRSVPAYALHPVYLRLLCDALAERGLDVPALLSAAGLSTANIAESAPPVNFPQVLALLRLVGHQCRDPLLPISWGRRIRPNVHGVVSTAIFSSNDVRQALQTAVALSSVRSTSFRPALREEGGRTRLEYDALVPLYEQHQFLTTAIAFMVIQVLRELLGRAIARVCVEFPFAAPAWAAERERHCPSEAVFDAPRLAFSMPTELLARALPSADVHTHEAAMRQCRIDMLGLTASLSSRVAAFLANRPETSPYPTLDEAAAHFCMSSRTLRRTLHVEGASYQQLFDLVRMEAARHLLGGSRLSVQQITERLGYADPSNFVRAFRRHHGHTPRQHRLLQATHAGT